MGGYALKCKRGEARRAAIEPGHRPDPPLRLLVPDIDRAGGAIHASRRPADHHRTTTPPARRSRARGTAVAAHRARRGYRTRLKLMPGCRGASRRGRSPAYGRRIIAEFRRRRDQADGTDHCSDAPHRDAPPRRRIAARGCRNQRAAGVQRRRKRARDRPAPGSAPSLATISASGC